MSRAPPASAARPSPRISDELVCPEAVHHPDRDRRRSGTFGSLVNTNLPSNFRPAELRRQRCLSQPDAEFAIPGGLERQPAGGRQRADQLLQRDRRHPAAVRRADAGGPDAGLRRERDRLAADHVRCDGPVHGPAHRSLHGRGGGVNGGAGATGYAEEDGASAYAYAASALKTSATRIAMFTKAPPARRL